jgi:integrase
MSGYVKKRGDTWGWYIETVDPKTGKRRLHSKGGFRVKRGKKGTGEVGAEDALEEARSKLRAGQLLVPRRERQTLGAVVESYLDALPTLPVKGGKAPKPSYVAYCTAMAKHLDPLAGFKLDELAATDLDRLYRDLGASGLSKSTLHGVHVLARKVLNFSVRKRLVAVNVALSADPPHVESKKERRQGWWSPEELTAFLEASADDELGALWALYGTTGCRRGEALALRWSDVKANKITICRNRVLVNYAPVEGAPKTTAGSRTIALDAPTAALLADLRQRQAVVDLDGHVFTDALGEPLHPETVSRRFAALLGAHGLRTITLHDVRHSYASAMVEAGEKTITISRRLGHSSTRVTEDLYVGVRQEVDEDLAKRSSSFLWGRQ